MRRPKRYNSRYEREREREREERLADGLLTILDFCEFAGISHRQYYVLKRAGRGPREMRLGDPSRLSRTVRITRDEAQAWAKRMTEEEAQRQ